jgi:hypothetical protein
MGNLYRRPDNNMSMVNKILRIMRDKYPDGTVSSFIVPDHMKGLYDELKKPLLNEYYIVDFLYCDIENDEPLVVNPQKVIDLENLKEFILHWWENKDVTKRLNNGSEVNLFPVVEAR